MPECQNCSSIVTRTDARPLRRTHVRSDREDGVRNGSRIGEMRF